MKIDLSKRYTTGDGREVKLWFIDETGPYPVKGAVRMKNGRWNLQAWAKDGEYGYSTVGLVEKPEGITVEMWVNVYDKKHFVILDTEESAKKSAKVFGKRPFARKKISFSVIQGNGLEEYK